SGPAIVPGKHGESLILQKIKTGRMPPPDRLVEASVKPVEPGEVELLEKWIAAGALEVPIRPDVATASPDPLVTEGDRNFWAFQPPRPVAIPKVRHPELTRNPIDVFILQRLEGQGIVFSKEASRGALIRRAYFDLTGLPPEP